MSIHPTAVVDCHAVLAEDVEVGPHAVIEAHTEIGPGCIIGANVVIRKYTSMGERNVVDSGAILGGDPQDLKFDRDSTTYLRIGNGNTFKECVTINRATREGQATVVGDNTYWMCYGHAGHDVTIGDNVIVAANTQIAGHCTVYDGAILPANGNIHQFCWIGRKVMFQGGTQVSMHVPPYVLAAGDNNIVSLNAVGLKRDSSLTVEDRKQIKEAFAITYRSGGDLEQIVYALDACEDFGHAADEFRKFIRMVALADKPYNRGLCPRLGRILTRKR